jgi:hypothetical protein
VHRSLDHVIGVRIPASQPHQIPPHQQLTVTQSNPEEPIGAPRALGLDCHVQDPVIQHFTESPRTTSTHG